MKATYKRYLAVAFATVGLVNLGVCQVSADPLGPASQVYPATPQPSQDTVTTTDLGLRSSITQVLDIKSIPQVQVNGTVVSFTGAQPGMINGQLMIPVRDIAEQLGATVHWDHQGKQVVLDLPSQKTVTLDTNRDWLTMIGASDVTNPEAASGPNAENSDFILPSDEVVLIGDRAYMPFDKLALAINASGDWDQTAGTATITTDANSTGEDSQVGSGTPLNNPPSSDEPKTTPNYDY